MDLFLEDLILNHLKPKRLSSMFTIERAHRAPIPRPEPVAPPRTIIAKILNYRDRDVIFQAGNRETCTTKTQQSYSSQILRSKCNGIGAPLTG